jgi:hypothetical protein
MSISSGQANKIFTLFPGQAAGVRLDMTICTHPPETRAVMARAKERELNPGELLLLVRISIHASLAQVIIMLPAARNQKP